MSSVENVACGKCGVYKRKRYKNVYVWIYENGTLLKNLSPITIFHLDFTTPYGRFQAM